MPRGRRDAIEGKLVKATERLDRQPSQESQSEVGIELNMLSEPGRSDVAMAMSPAPTMARLRDAAKTDVFAPA